MIFQILEDEAPISKIERDCILDSIHMGIALAAGEFTKAQNTLREQFIALLSHDLRNPLSAIKTCAQVLLRNSNQVEKVQMMGTRIVDSVKRADNMIRDLLDTFQIRAGQKLPITPEACDLKVIATQALEELSTIHGDRFVLNASENEINGYWSVEGLIRCIENLANNAVKYGDPYQKITLCLEAENDTIKIEMNNKGKPLSAAEQVELFSAFHRGPMAKLGDKTGWGLGLTLVKGMAEAHGGQVSVISEEHKGTTFKITLPRDARSVQEK